jgi:hypothetical protein
LHCFKDSMPLSSVHDEVQYVNMFRLRFTVDVDSGVPRC